MQLALVFTAKACHHISTCSSKQPYLCIPLPCLVSKPKSSTSPKLNIKHFPFMAEKEGGTVHKGHEEGMKTAASILQEFELPMGLLPLCDVTEVGFVKSTGYMWIVQKKKVEHEFKMIKKKVSYDSEISGFVSKKKIKKLKGVKAKELMLWPPVNEISVDDPPTGKIHFRSLAGVSKTFPVEAFEAAL